MTEMTTEAIIDRLITEGYPAAQAPAVAERLLALPGPFSDAFVLWMDSGELAQVESDGYSLRSLVDDHDVKMPGAILTLDWLRRDPEAARQTIHRRDRVIPRQPSGE